MPEPFETERLSPHLGVKVMGVVAQDLSDNTFGALRQTWLDAGGFMVLKDQRLTTQDQITFSHRFGDLFGDKEPLQTTVSRYLHPDHPEIYRVSNKVDLEGQELGRARAGTYWHSDVSFKERPAMASLLYGIEIPPLGGDTLFANMTLAFDALSDAMKALLAPLNAVHDFAIAAASQYARAVVIDSDMDGQNRARHPVVRTHADTGAKSLFINPGFTSHLEGFAPDESRALLDFLFAHATQPEFVYRHAWDANDLVIWDNRSLMHYAIADYTDDRYLERTTVIGERPR